MHRYCDCFSVSTSESACKLHITKSLDSKVFSEIDINDILENATTSSIFEIHASNIHWNASSIIFLSETIRLAEQRGLKSTLTNIPEKVTAILNRNRTSDADIASATPKLHISPLKEIINGISFAAKCAKRMLFFFGKKSYFDKGEFFLCAQAAGAEAIPIVGMLNFLVGAIIAFVGSIQLEKFGANIFVADLVAISMAREIGSLITSIIIIGRSGASFAASIGTMTANEEIDALNVLGVNIVDHLVIPRILALIVVTPLLCGFAIFLGIAGGAMVCLLMLNISIQEYANEVKNCLSMTTFSIGVIKGAIFGSMIATIGCWRGISCNRNALSIGEETTRAVVYSITALVIADSIITVVLGIVCI